MRKKKGIDMVDKAKIQAYIATLPPKERAKFQKLPKQQQISIMNKALGTTSTKPKANSNTSSFLNLVKEL